MMGKQRIVQSVSKVILASVLLCFIAGCPLQRNGRTPQPNKALLNDKGKLEQDERRELFAQIVEDTLPESAIIEGKPFKWFLKECSKTNHDALRKSSSEQILFDDLMSQPGMYRGRVVTQNRGVIVEVASAVLPAEYGLPGYTVLPATFVDVSHDVYSVRILCAPGSKTFEKLKSGIDDDSYPVVRLTGYFMKIYARRTAREGEPAWQRPLLICPEPEFSLMIEPRNLWQEFVDGKVADLLPSERIDAPGVEERLVVHVSVARSGSGKKDSHDSSEIRCSVGGQTLLGELNPAIAQAVASFKKRLPRSEEGHLSAVVLLAASASKDSILKVVEALRAAGVKRLAVKREQ